MIENKEHLHSEQENEDNNVSFSFEETYKDYIQLYQMTIPDISKEQQTIENNIVEKLINRHNKWLEKEDDGQRLTLFNKKINDNFNFDGLNLSNASFYHCDLSNLRFYGVSLKNALFYDCKMDGTIFWLACLNGTNFINCSMCRTNMCSTDLLNTIFINCNLIETKIHPSMISNILFDGCDNVEKITEQLYKHDFLIR